MPGANIELIINLCEHVVYGVNKANTYAY